MSVIHLLLCLSLMLLSACSLAPKYEPPPMPIPAHYKEAGRWISTNSPIAFNPQQGPWWTLYQDQTLNDLEKGVSLGNQPLKIALARYQEACAIAQSVRSALYPTVNGIGNAVRQKIPTTIANSNYTPVSLFDTYLLGASLSYEIDAWGQIRNAVAASNLQARASSFDLAAADLSMHAELAQDYFQLRGDEAAQRVLDATVIAYQKAFNLTKQRHDLGLAPEADMDQAETQLQMAKTMAIDIRLQRAQMEHAIAVLIGEIPSNFSLPVYKNRSLKHVTMIPELPSTLLLRRPDIAAAEQRVAAANASIGVARAAFYPSFNFSSLIGQQSSQLSTLFAAPSLFWAVGTPAALALAQPLVTQVLFDGYNLQALLKKAKASYYESVSQYRQVTLVAFKEVEDALVAIRRLDEEITTQRASMVAAKRALYQANQRYKGGVATFLDVIITENEALQAELGLVNILTRRQVASVHLIRALGGGWNMSI